MCTHFTWKPCSIIMRRGMVAATRQVCVEKRFHKAALSEAVARERLLLGSATSFDPTIVRAFLHLLDTRPNFTLPQRVCPLPERVAQFSPVLVDSMTSL